MILTDSTTGSGRFLCLILVFSEETGRPWSGVRLRSNDEMNHKTLTHHGATAYGKEFVLVNSRQLDNRLDSNMTTYFEGGNSSLGEESKTDMRQYRKFSTCEICPNCLGARPKPGQLSRYNYDMPYRAKRRLARATAVAQQNLHYPNYF